MARPFNSDLVLDERISDSTLRAYAKLYDWNTNHILILFRIGYIKLLKEGIKLIQITHIPYSLTIELAASGNKN